MRAGLSVPLEGADTLAEMEGFAESDPGESWEGCYREREQHV